MKLCKWKHKKSGNIYYVIDDHVINTTTAHKGIVMVTYYGKELGEPKPKRYCREKTEFEEKFELIGCM